ncbi:hypothetical protein GIW74_26590, partial [Pseudomonas syringae]|nr:hypothetical protein [Pseudomonas syringae]
MASALCPPRGRRPPPHTPPTPPPPPDTPDTAILDAALRMVEVWNRLSADKQAQLLERFGTQENALA